MGNVFTIELSRSISMDGIAKLLRKQTAVSWVVILCAFISAAPRLQAACVIINATDTGWYDETGRHIASNSNYVTGQLGILEYNSWFLFDLSSVTGPITGVTLTLDQNASPPGYLSPDASETFELHDVTTPNATLTAGGTGLTGIYNDLGSGISFGSTSVDASTVGGSVTVTLNAAGIAATEAARASAFPSVSYGGTVTTIGSPSTSEYTFGYSHQGSPLRYIKVTFAPEPSRICLLGLGFAISLCARRRKERTSFCLSDHQESLLAPAA